MEKQNNLSPDLTGYDNLFVLSNSILRVRQRSPVSHYACAWLLRSDQPLQLLGCSGLGLPQYLTE